MTLGKLRYPPDPGKVRIATVDDLGRELELAPIGRESKVAIPWKGKLLRWPELVDMYRVEMVAAGRDPDPLLRRLCVRRGIEP